jgi:hypothetical protein
MALRMLLFLCTIPCNCVCVCDAAPLDDFPMVGTIAAWVRFTPPAVVAGACHRCMALFQMPLPTRACRTSPLSLLLLWLWL